MPRLVRVSTAQRLSNRAVLGCSNKRATCLADRSSSRRHRLRFTSSIGWSVRVGVRSRAGSRRPRHRPKIWVTVVPNTTSDGSPPWGTTSSTTRPHPSPHRPASKTQHRLNPRGNRQLNHAIRMIAVTQIRNDTPATRSPDRGPPLVFDSIWFQPGSSHSDHRASTIALMAARWLSVMYGIGSGEIITNPASSVSSVTDLRRARQRIAGDARLRRPRHVRLHGRNNREGRGRGHRRALRGPRSTGTRLGHDRLTTMIDRRSR